MAKETTNFQSVRVTNNAHELLKKVKEHKGISMAKFIEDAVHEKVIRDYKKLL